MSIQNAANFGFVVLQEQRPSGMVHPQWGGIALLMLRSKP
jgi:hypothetical protein